MQNEAVVVGDIEKMLKEEDTERQHHAQDVSPRNQERVPLAGSAESLFRGPRH